jgi:hypothetical protein
MVFTNMQVPINRESGPSESRYPDLGGRAIGKEAFGVSIISEAVLSLFVKASRR